MSDIKTIKLTKGKVAVVDAADYDYLMQWKWYCSTWGYAVRGIRNEKGGVSHVRMHRVVNHTPQSMETDHINGDRLDNRRSNLRSVTHGQNIMNRQGTRNTTGFKGVTYHKQAKKWMAQIYAQGVKYHLGLFATPEIAYEAYKEAARKYHGQYARY